MNLLPVFFFLFCLNSNFITAFNWEDYNIVLEDSTKPKDDYNLSSNPTLKIGNHPRLGAYLTDTENRTLYMFTPDRTSVSQCEEACAKTWPPYLVNDEKTNPSSEIVGRLTVSQRKDGTWQVNYNGMPLYYYADDKKPGDIKGQGVENKWFIVSPISGPIRNK